MIYEIGKYLHQHAIDLSFFRLVNYITFRAIMAALTAVILMFLFSRRFILFMHRKSILDQVRDTGVSSAFDKRGTPTMGGVLIIVAVLIAMLLWGNWRNPFLIYSVAGMLWFGLLGFWDDYAKVQKRSGDKGLSEQIKLMAQTIFALAFAWCCLGPLTPFEGALPTELHSPFYKYVLMNLTPIGYGILILIFTIFVSNAVNITDGLDGLAITPSLFVVSVLGVFAYVEGNRIYAAYLYYPYLKGAGELTVFAAAFVGAGLGFLWYNAYPAQIFMGDTGSLAIGGAVAVMSVLLKQELLFPLLGALFLAEALSSQIQDKIGVKWVGRRILFRAPLHHDLQHKGIAETKVVIRLWIVSGILALISLATLKLR